jgi:hypothetical protein
MPNEVKIEITGDSTGAVGAATETKDAIKDLGGAAGGSVSQGMKDLGAETEKTSEKFITNRREVRSAFNALSEAFGMGRLGGLVAGGFFASIAAMAASVNFLKWTWNELKNTISGPIDIGLPPDAHSRITAVAEAWNDYATARAKILAEQNTPQTAAGEQEKHLVNELKLIHEVLAAQKEKALADLEMQKAQMAPEVYAGSRANIENIFAEAGVKADEHNRYQQTVNKQTEAANLEFDAQIKMRQALLIKLAPKETAEANEKFYAEQSAKAEIALKTIKDRIDLIVRVSKPDQVAEYEGASGKLRGLKEGYDYYTRYGLTGAADALALEKTRAAQAQALIDSGAGYKAREDAARKQRDELTGTAGRENAEAAGIRGQIPGGLRDQAAQTSVDQYVAGLHRESADKIAGGSAETAQAVRHFTDTAVAGFSNIATVVGEHDRRLDQLARQISAMAGHTFGGQ